MTETTDARNAATASRVGYQAPASDVPLTVKELVALREACCSVDVLRSPEPSCFRKLLRHRYVDIVLGRLEITQQGLERLLIERARAPRCHPRHCQDRRDRRSMDP